MRSVLFGVVVALAMLDIGMGTYLWWLVKSPAEERQTIAVRSGSPAPCATAACRTNASPPRVTAGAL